MGASCGHCTCSGRDVPRIRHVATGMRRDPLPYAKIAPMMQCAMGAIYVVMHVCCTYSRYSHSMVKNYLQFVPVCRSLFYLHPVSKNDEIPWGQIWVTDFGAGQGDTMGHGGSRRMGGASCVISSTGKPWRFEELKHRLVRGLDARAWAGRCSAQARYTKRFLRSFFR